MTKLIDLPQEAKLARLTHGFFEDFDHYVTADRWTTVTSVDVTATVGDAVGGRLSLLSAVVSADNEITLAHSTAEIFLFAADKPLEFEAYVQFTEVNTDDANVFVGLSSVVDATLLGDNGGGPPGTYDGVGFYKVDGGTTWVAETSFATTQTTTALDGTSYLNGQLVSAQTAGGAAYQRLGISCQPKANSVMDVEFLIDGVLVAKHTDVAMTTPEEMHVALAMKDGSATNEETLVVDYVWCYQAR